MTECTFFWRGLGCIGKIQSNPNKCMHTSGKEKVAIPNVFIHHEINTSCLWLWQVQEGLKVVATGVQTFVCAANYCLGHLLMLHS